jgi:formate hydrogenlyase transcriptional activator
MRLHVLETSAAMTVQAGREFSVEQSPAGRVVGNQRPLVVPDIEKETRFPQAIELMRQAGIRAFCGLPLTTASARWASTLAVFRRHTM